MAFFCLSIVVVRKRCQRRVRLFRRRVAALDGVEGSRRRLAERAGRRVDRATSLLVGVVQPLDLGDRLLQAGDGVPAPSWPGSSTPDSVQWMSSPRPGTRPQPIGPAVWPKSRPNCRAVLPACCIVVSSELIGTSVSCDIVSRWFSASICPSTPSMSNSRNVFPSCFGVDRLPGDLLRAGDLLGHACQVVAGQEQRLRPPAMFPMSPSEIAVVWPSLLDRLHDPVELVAHLAGAAGDPSAMSSHCAPRSPTALPTAPAATPMPATPSAAMPALERIVEKAALPALPITPSELVY